MEVRQDVTLYHGQDTTIEVTLLDDTGTAIPANTIAGARWQVADEPGGTALLTKLLGAGQLTISNGLATIIIADTDWHNGTVDVLEPGGIYEHELALRNTVGDKYPVCRGLVYVRPSAAGSA